MLSKDKDFVILDKKEEEKKSAPARQHGLFLLNSDYTEYGCVVGSLAQALALGEDGAKVLAEKAHKDGEALIGMFNKDIAETKAYMTYEKLCELHAQKGLDNPTTIFTVKEV